MIVNLNGPGQLESIVEKAGFLVKSSMTVQLVLYRIVFLKTLYKMGPLPLQKLSLHFPDRPA